VFEKSDVFSNELMTEDYFKLPIDLNNTTMMENSDDKFMSSSKVGEFNNVTCGPNGLFNSSLTNAVLSIQPLTGDNPLDDIINVVSSARATLQWGTSLDVIRSSYYCNIVQLQQKWMFKQEEVDYLISMGLLPSCDEEIIEGFSIRTRETRLRLLQHVEESDLDDILKGDMELNSVLRSFRVRDSKSKRRIKAIDYISQTTGVMKTFRRITASRRVRGRMNAAIMRPLPVAKRLAVKTGFMNLIYRPVSEVTAKMSLVSDTLKEPYKVILYPMYPRMAHLMPFKMGDSRSKRKTLDLNKIRVHRFTGLCLTDPLNPEELEISKLEEEEFLKKEFALESESNRYGGAWVSPAGASLMRFHNSTMFKMPVAFTYKVDLPIEDWVKGPTLINGLEYTDFEPTHISGLMISKAKVMKAMLPYGTAWRSGYKYALLMLTNGENKALLINDTSSNMTLIRSPIIRKPLLVFNRLNPSPIELTVFDYVVPSWINNTITGDPTAMLNYGNYLNTRSQGAQKLRQSIFEMLSCREPNWSFNRLHEFPYHLPNSKKIKSAKVNYLVGSRQSCLLELDFSNPEIVHQTIELSGSTIETRVGLPKTSDEEEFWG
jgi:hypothetical protein